MEENNKFFIEASIEVMEETADRKEKASKVIELPPEKDKQPDLMYISAILVSSGENLNHAHFMTSELVAAEGTIINKALDVEHLEQEVIGHIYERAYMTKDGEPLDIKELASKETATIDKQEIHIAIAGIIYKNRFPNIAKEVAEGKYKVSMECYYQGYDVKVGELLLDPKEAEMLGLATKDDSLLGRTAKVIKKGKEIASGTVARVLRGICFCGCGIVENPANPPSVIMEVGGEKEKNVSEDGNDIIVLDYDKLEEDNNVTANKTDTYKKEESIDGLFDDTQGICVYYKRRIEDKDGNIEKENWCVAYEGTCTSFPRNTSDPDCLRNKNIVHLTKAAFDICQKRREAEDRRKELLEGLRAALREAVKTQSR